MNTLRIQEWNKPERTFEFIGWRRDRKALFLRDQQGRRYGVQLELPCPHDGHYVRSPFPDSAPVEIRKARIVPPPCRATKEETKRIFDKSLFGTVPDPWEMAYGGEVLSLTPEDDAPLIERLAKFKAIKQREYEGRKQELAKLTEADVRLILDGENSDSPLAPERYRKYVDEQTHALEEIFNAPARELRPDGPWVAGHLNLTLEMVKEGNAAGIRNAYAQDWWAKTNGFDLHEMEGEKSRFMEFIRQNVVNVTKNTFDARTRTSYQKPGLRLWRDAEEVLCASVRYTIHFADGTRLWLDGYELRDLLDANECSEFDVCLGASPTNGNEQPAPAKKREAVFSDDFTQATIPDGRGKPKTLALEPEQTKLVKRIVDEPGHSIARKKLVEEQVAGTQPEKYFKRGALKELWDAKVIGKSKTGRLTTYWVRLSLD